MDNTQVAKELVRIAREIISASQTPFEKALDKAIKSKIKELKKDGTSSMGLDNLIQAIRPPSSSLEGAPKGTNARYMYKQIFQDLVKGNRFVKASSREASASPAAQDVIVDLKPVQKGSLKIREKLRDEGESREADAAYLELNGMVNDLIKELKKY